MVDRLSHHQLFLLVRLLLSESVLQFLGLAALHLHELALVLDCLGLEDLVEHLLDGLELRVVLDPEAIEDGVEVHFALEDVVVHAADAVHGCLELLVLALLQEFEGVLLRRRFSLHLIISLMESVIVRPMKMELTLSG